MTWWVGSSILSHHPARFGGLRCCGGGDIRFFICHVASGQKGNVVGGLSNLTTLSRDLVRGILSP